MGPENFTIMSPRSQSSERSPNGSSDLQSCVRFTEFPASVTFDFGGTAAVQEILAVGNSAEPKNSNNFKVFASMNEVYDEVEDACLNNHLFPDSDPDYMTDDTRLGDVADC